MTTHISLDASVVEDNNVQFIPCSIDYNGRAEVSSYFKDKTESNGTKIVSFRGRPLFGSEVQLPEGYCGYVLRKGRGGTSESRVHDIDQSFKKITYWNLDRIPSQNDAIVSALDWINVSKAIHEKVELVDLMKVSSSMNGQIEKPTVENGDSEDGTAATDKHSTNAEDTDVK